MSYGKPNKPYKDYILMFVVFVGFIVLVSIQIGIHHGRELAKKAMEESHHQGELK